MCRCTSGKTFACTFKQTVCKVKHNTYYRTPWQINTYLLDSHDSGGLSDWGPVIRDGRMLRNCDTSSNCTSVIGNRSLGHVIPLHRVTCNQAQPHSHEFGGQNFDKSSWFGGDFRLVQCILSPYYVGKLYDVGRGSVYILQLRWSKQRDVSSSLDILKC